MKMTIDTDMKTIQIEQSCNLGHLMKTLSEMFPDGAWREYTIEGYLTNIRFNDYTKAMPVFSTGPSTGISPYGNFTLNP